MENYIKAGRMSRIPQSEQGRHPQVFFPHHAVWKGNDTNRKIRVVFDASTKPIGGRSFNDCSIVGPTIQEDIVHLLLTFRKHKYALVGDIKQMYPQIGVEPKTAAYQKVLWPPSEGSQMEIIYQRLNYTGPQ
jgi:hypothetical protein